MRYLCFKEMKVIDSQSIQFQFISDLKAGTVIPIVLPEKDEAQFHRLVLSMGDQRGDVTYNSISPRAKKLVSAIGTVFLSSS